jgi:DNA-binding beta-propeller fold protein YncE
MILAMSATGGLEAEKGDKPKKDKKGKGSSREELYADYVWPPPPDEARIRLVDVIFGRADIEASSKFTKALIGSEPTNPYDLLTKPFGVDFDSTGRVLVTDSVTAALLRFDRDGRRFDVLGTRGAVRLGQPLGLCVGPDDTVYVADTRLRRVVAFDSEGKITKLFGAEGELLNPTDALVGPGAKLLYVADSKAHHILVFDLASGRLLSSFGNRGEGDGEFNYPTSLALSIDGDLLVVDQANARVQVFDIEGNYVDQFGARGSGPGQFTRPKDVAVDRRGFIYVTDNAFNNVQLFDVDFQLLTFVGSGGRGPGAFWGASGVAVRGDEFAVVDQLGHRLQLFRFLETVTGE